MLISTKGRYAIRVLVDMAEHNGLNVFQSLPDISERQEISLKYIEKIMTLLVKNNMIISVRGKSGGYKLVKDPSEYDILSILKITEETLAPVHCLEDGAEICPRKQKCKTLNLWKETYDLITNHFKNKTIADLMSLED